MDADSELTARRDGGSTILKGASDVPRTFAWAGVWYRAWAFHQGNRSDVSGNFCAIFYDRA